MLPEYREFERWSTTALNAYVAPLIDKYLARLEAGLGRRRLSIMQSNGGSIQASLARAQAVRTVLSGPAAGVVGATRSHGRRRGSHHFLRHGRHVDGRLPDGRGDPDVDRSRIGDFPVRLPVIDIHTVGAGGGSIAYVDSGGALRVGPRSAGAVPGPVCYGAGTELTVTDANLLLGRLDPDFFLGGRMSLDVASDGARRSRPREQPKLSLGELAEGIVRVANANMERAIRVVSVQRGHDPRDFALLAFGGAGGMHACDIASTLEIDTVIVPRHAGVLSALGMLVADVTRDYSASVRCRPPRFGQAVEGATRSALHARASRTGERRLRQQRTALELPVDVRYVGQSYEITLPFSSTFQSEFHEQHARLYGYANGSAARGRDVRVKAIGLTEKPSLPFEKPARASRPNRCGCSRDASAAEPPGVFHRWPRSVTRRGRAGPAVVAGAEATVVVPPGFTFQIDGFGNVRSHLRGRRRAAPQMRIDPIEFEVFKNLFLSIAEEMGVTLCRTSFSPNIKERLDYSCAIYDSAGETIAQGDHMPVHLGAMPLSVRAAIEPFAMEPGDIVMLNDPFHGGTHLPDITMVSPVFLGREGSPTSTWRTARIIPMSAA